MYGYIIIYELFIQTDLRTDMLIGRGGLLSAALSAAARLSLLTEAGTHITIGITLHGCWQQILNGI